MININIREANKCNGDYSLYLSFDYDARIVDIVKSLATRVYNKDTKEWEVPLRSLSKVVDSLSAYDIEITGKYINLHEDEEVELPADFTFKTSPFEHQIEGVKFGLSHNKWLLGDEQGLGKTKQVIDLANARNVKHCLIVCCVNGLKWNWRNEVHTHSNEDAWILGYRDGKIGSNADRLDDLQDADALPRFIITNIETLRYNVPTGNKIAKKVNGRMKEVDEVIYPITDRLKELCESGEIEMIAVDEFHKCKNPDAVQAQQILRLQADYQVAMTGTPLMNAPLDLFMPLKWLGYEKHSFYQFRSHHCTFGGYGGYQITGYRYLEELTETLDEIMLRRLKEDVLDLPDKIFINDYVDMGDKQKKVYYSTHEDIAGNLDKIKMANNPLAELIRLRQATGNPSILASSVTDNAKFDRMEEIVDDAIENGQKVVIFSNWTQMTNPAFARLSKKYTGVMITGETKDNERQANVDRFQTDDRCKFIVGTIGAMGTGLTLTAGTVEIFLDEPWNMALKEQAVDRCHRIGAKSNVTIYTLLCKGTIDERINELVEKKGEMSNILVDGKVEGDKNALINYLLS
jgi:SNF2 family DNA or RNA helicase